MNTKQICCKIILGEDTYEIKLIKNTPIGQNYWSGSSNNQSNSWINSTLRTEVLNNENGDYWMSLGTDASKVVVHNWKITGGGSAEIISSNAKCSYDKELDQDCVDCKVSDKVGLIYVSDFRYASKPNNWSDSGGRVYSSYSSNWLHLSAIGSSAPEWTISPQTGTDIAMDILSNGNVASHLVYDYRASIRPCIYLESSTEFSSGFGTSENPYRIF